MSVPRSQRKVANVAYIANAKKLATKVFAYSERLPKRYAFKIGNPLFEHAHMVVHHVKAANNTYVDNGRSFRVRREHLKEAEHHLDSVEDLLEILHLRGCELAARGDGKPPNNNVFEEFYRLIDGERALITKVKQSDTARFNRQQAKKTNTGECEAGGEGTSC